MNRIYIVTIILLVLALIFAIQNVTPISLHFLFWSFQGSLALVAILLFVVGFFSGWLLEARAVWIKSTQLKNVQKQLDDLQKSIKNINTNPGR